MAYSLADFPRLFYKGIAKVRTDDLWFAGGPHPVTVAHVRRPAPSRLGLRWLCCLYRFERSERAGDSAPG